MIIFYKKIVACSLYAALLFCLALNSLSWWLLTTFPLSSLHRRMIPQTQYDKENDNNNNTLPEWITSYMIWHKETRLSLTENNWQDHKYLVARCHAQDVPCGGLADRLRALPFLVQVAAMTGRLLFISWERPYDLKEFLHPADKVDWRLPPFVQGPNRQSNVFTQVDQIDRIQKSTDTVVSVRFQAYKQAEKFFDRYKVKPEDPDMTDVLAPLWHKFFRPAPPVQEQIDVFYRHYNLTATEPSYLAAHLRVLYHHTPSHLVEQVRNALACTSQFSVFDVDVPILVTSDSQQATDIALQLAARQVVTSLRTGDNDVSYPTLHLDRGKRFLENPNDNSSSDKEFEIYPVEAYYDTFVDLYLLMGAQCVALDRGGFGRLASLLSTHPKCLVNHRHRHC